MNYPNGIKKQTLHNKASYDSELSHKNRGMTLEGDLKATNDYYLINDLAVIYKKPTPITISKVNYPSRLEAVIKEGYFRTPSTTDYNGVYRGKYIDFEAKETKSHSSFPLNNIHKHQIEHLQKIEEHGGIGFLIVRFTSINKTFYLSFEKLNDFLLDSGRKSIPLSYFMDNGYLIKDKYNPRVDYLSVIDDLYFGGKK